MSDTTVYTLYPEVETDERGRYFDGQFLTAQDFVDEQRYHTDRLRRVLDLLTIAGVARGLELAAAGPWTLRLGAGTALDARGRLLVVPRERADIEVPRDLPGGAADVSLFYSEVESRVQGGTTEEEGTRGATRLRELPALEFHPVGSDPSHVGAVLVGRLRVNGDGVITLDPPETVRQAAGLRLPGLDDLAPTLRSGGQARPTLLEATGNLNVVGKLAVGAPDPESALDVRGLARLDDISVRTHELRVEGDETKFYPIVFRDLDWAAGAAVLEISRADAQADVANAGSFMAILRWHASDGHGSESFSCEIHQSRRFLANNRLLSGALLVTWLRGARTYAWRAGQRIELADGRALDSKTVAGQVLASTATIPAIFDRDHVLITAGLDAFELRGPLNVAGNVSYSGTQSKLNTAEQPSATVRAADLYLGHSTRRGQPGRALVDGGSTLVVNHSGDWGIVRLGGPKSEVAGDLRGFGSLTIDGASTLSNSLAVTGAVTLASTLAVTGALSAAATVAVTGALTVDDDAVFKKAADITGALTVGGSATLTGATTISGDLTAARALAVGGSLNVTGGATISGALSTSGVFTANQNAALKKALAVTGATTLSGTLSVGGSSTLAGAVSAQSTLAVTGNTSVGGALSVTGAATLSSALSVGGALTVTGSASVGGTFSATGNATLSGTLAVANNATVSGDLTVTNGSPFLQVRRPRPQAAGGTMIFLELYQDDTASKTVPEVGVSLRFHHSNRYYHRIEGAANGLHVRSGDPGSSDYRSLYAGNVLVNGKHAVAGTNERLRIIRGTVDASGTRIEGSGFSVSKSGSLWKITFDEAFNNEPTVLAAQQYPDDNKVDGNGGNTRDNAIVVGVKTSECYIKTGDSGGDHSWRRFHFIAVGTYNT